MEKTPVNKDLHVCYNCASEEYYLNDYTGKVSTRCIYAQARKFYDPAIRETCGCRFFERRKPRILKKE